MRIQSFVFACFLLIGCSNKTKIRIEDLKEDNSNYEVTLNDNLVHLFYGVDTKVDTSNFIEMAMYSLIKSDYETYSTIIKNRYVLDTIKYSGYYGFQLSSNGKQSDIINYILFEKENSLDNLPMEAQKILLVGSLLSANDTIYRLQDIELKYVENNKHKSGEDAAQSINEVMKLKEQFNGSQRLDFILAKEYLIAGDEKKALIIYDKLIKNNYYALASLRSVIDYFSEKKDLVSRDRYISILKERFPNQCIIDNIVYSPSNDSVIEVCNQCIKSIYQKDSIKAKLVLARYFLYTKNYRKLDSSINDYFNHYTELNVDSFSLYERGMYFDLKMRSFFLQKEYVSLCKFAHNDLEYNLLISISNDKEFGDYIKFLYSKYISTDLSKFPEFFRSNFNSCVE